MAPNRKTAPRNDDADAIFSLESLKDFIRFFEKVDVAQVEVKVRDKSLVLSKQSSAVPIAPVHAPVAAVPVPQAAASAPVAAPSVKPSPASNLVDITSPIVGTFYRSSDPGSPAFVNVGDAVAPGKVVCIIEAMKIFNEIKAEAAGVIREICVENEQPVEYGQVLFRIEKK